MDFNYTEFERLLNTIASGRYTFLRFDSEEGADAAFYLRHDVDLSALAARDVGRIESRNGVVANFFFQIGSETYNIFSPRVIEIMAELREHGHVVGLHLDQETFSDDGESVARTLDWFGECVAPVDRVVSFHRPSPSVLNRTFDGFVSAYESRFFGPELYLSDSRRDAGFHARLVDWMGERRAPIQLLLHPGWWYDEPDIRGFKDALVSRRSAELEAYLRDHMRKVFGEVVDDEDSSPGL